MSNFFTLEETGRKFPKNLLPSLYDIKFVCPKCRKKLTISDNEYFCQICSKHYPLHNGIPDFRLFPDPFLNYEEDFQRTEIVLAALDELNFEKLLEHYWSFSDITPAALRPKFIRSALFGETRARRTLEILKDKINQPIKYILEIGSGTGNFLFSAVKASKLSNEENYLKQNRVIGIDAAMRWLHLSRRRFIDAGLPIPPLVCCNAEFLPFADETFDLVVAASTLEFVSDQEKVFGECARVLNENGNLYINSVNRFSIAKDPYAYLWGVGFLPRRWQARYVKWRRDASYENVKTLSYREINQLADKYFPVREFALPEVDRSIINEFPLFLRIQVRLYQALKKFPLISILLKHFGPGWDAIFRKNTLPDNSFSKS
ncbi:MAG: methyltransferase domain-containing protein [Pyrinomonadaceae bacterium]